MMLAFQSLPRAWARVNKRYYFFHYVDFLKQNNKRRLSSFTCKFLLLQFLQDLFPPALTNCPWVSQDAGLSVFLLKTLLHKQKRERLCKAKYKFQDIMWSFEMGFFISRIIFFCNRKFSTNFDLPHWLIRHTDTSLSYRQQFSLLSLHVNVPDVVTLKWF